MVVVHAMSITATASTPQIARMADPPRPRWVLSRLRAAAAPRISRIMSSRMAWAGEDLIRRMAQGDADACGRFYDRYARLVYPLIVRIVGEPADAADVLQEVFWE